MYYKNQMSVFLMLLYLKFFFYVCGVLVRFFFICPNLLNGEILTFVFCD